MDRLGEKTMGGEVVDPFFGVESADLLEAAPGVDLVLDPAIDLFELFDRIDFVFFLRDGEIGMAALDPGMEPLVSADDPDVLLHSFPFLMGRVPLERVVGAEGGTLLDEFPVGGRVLGIDADMQVAIARKLASTISERKEKTARLNIVRHRYSLAI